MRCFDVFRCSTLRRDTPDAPVTHREVNTRRCRHRVSNGPRQSEGNEAVKLLVVSADVTSILDSRVDASGLLTDNRSTNTRRLSSLRWSHRVKRSFREAVISRSSIFSCVKTQSRAYLHRYITFKGLLTSINHFRAAEFLLCFCSWLRI